MPAPVVHIARAQQWLAKNPDFEPGPFMRGTIFPDIRYLGVISRDESHRGPATIGSVQTAPSAFEAGRRFHCLMDQVWNDYFRSLGFGRVLDDDPATTIAIKGLEVLAVGPTIGHRDKIAGYFSVADPQTRTRWGIDEEHVIKFQAAVAADMTGPFELEAAMARMGRIIPDARLIERIKVRARQIQADAAWQERIDGIDTAIARALST